jgi:hypothetical protein
MIERIIGRLSVLVGTALIVESLGCGTIMYPQREGQRGGRLDIGVVLLDAIGLVFFIIPGIIAYAVDFSEGTIYLPGGPKSALNGSGIRRIKFDPSKTNALGIERIVERETGAAIRTNQKNLQISRLNSVEELQEHVVSQ